MSSVDQRTQSVSIAQFDIAADETHRMQRRREIQTEIARQDIVMTEAFGRICPDCGHRLNGHGKTHPKEVWTLAGLIKVSLKRLYCPVCRHIHIPGKRLTTEPLLSSLAQVFVAFTKENTFATSRRLLKEVLKLDIPTMTLHAYIQAQRHFFDTELLDEVDALYTNGEAPQIDVSLKKGTPLYLAIDEGLMHEWSYCHGKATKPEHKKFVTAYTAVFFDGRKCISGEKVLAKNRRYALTHRYAHASATTDLDQYFRELVTLSIKRGLKASNPLYVLTDGARYLTKAVTDYFPDAVLLLDIFHLRQHLEEVIDTQSSYFIHINKALYAYDPHALYQLVQNYICTDEGMRKKQIKLLGYIKRNAHAIANHRIKGVGVHGSSAAEKSVDLLIKRRFKGRGMSWTDKGAQALLYFRVLEYNGRWDSYWNARHRQSAEETSLAREKACIAATPPASLASAPAKPAYYHQVHLIDCEKTKGLNLN